MKSDKFINKNCQPDNFFQKWYLHYLLQTKFQAGVLEKKNIFFSKIHKKQ